MYSVDIVRFIREASTEKKNMFNIFGLDRTWLLCHIYATVTDKQVTVIKWQVNRIKGRRCLWQCAIHVGGKHTQHLEKANKQDEARWRML